MKTRMGFAATAVGAGLTLCNPVVGAFVAVIGVASMVKGLQSHRPVDRSSLPPAGAYQVAMAAFAFINGFIGLALGATMFCGEACAIAPEYSLMSSALFFGAMAICVWQATMEDTVQAEQKSLFAAPRTATRDNHQIVRSELSIAPQLANDHPYLLGVPESIEISEDGVYWFTIDSQPQEAKR